MTEKYLLPRKFIGKTVFRMFRCTGDKPVAIYKATVVSVAGSWVTLANQNGPWRENGFRWHETVRDAIRAFVDYQLAFVGIYKPSDPRHIEAISLIHAAVDEAMEWGDLCGMGRGFVQASKTYRNLGSPRLQGAFVVPGEDDHDSGGSDARLPCPG